MVTTFHGPFSAQALASGAQRIVAHDRARGTATAARRRGIRDLPLQRRAGKAHLALEIGARQRAPALAGASWRGEGKLGEIEQLLDPRRTGSPPRTGTRGRAASPPRWPSGLARAEAPSHSTTRPRSSPAAATCAIMTALPAPRSASAPLRSSQRPLDVGDRGHRCARRASAQWSASRQMSAMWPTSSDSLPLPPALRAASSMSMATPPASTGFSEFCATMPAMRRA